LKRGGGCVSFFSGDSLMRLSLSPTVSGGSFGEGEDRQWRLLDRVVSD